MVNRGGTKGGMHKKGAMYKKGGMYDPDDMNSFDGGFDGGIDHGIDPNVDYRDNAMTGGRSAWMIHLMRVYQQGKARDPQYRFSRALKDASKTYTSNSTKVAPKKKKEAKTQRGKNAWNLHVMDTFKKGQARNPDYGLDDAMIDASNTYKK
jgi:hypothetical protein